MGFSRQEYWSGVPFPLLGYLPNLGIEPASLAPLALAGRFFFFFFFFFTTSATWEAQEIPASSGEMAPISQGQFCGEGYSVCC